MNQADSCWTWTTAKLVGNFLIKCFWALVWLVGLCWTIWTIMGAYWKYHQYPSVITETKISDQGSNIGKLLFCGIKYRKYIIKRT